MAGVQGTAPAGRGREQAEGAAAFWRHPSGLLLLVAALSAMSLTLAFPLAADPVAAHRLLGLCGMIGGAMAGYVASALGHWVGRGPVLPGPVLALLWAAGLLGALVDPERGAFWSFALLAVALAIALPALWTPAIAPVHRLLACVPILPALFPALGDSVPPGALTLLPATLILWVGGGALPAFLRAEAARRGQVGGPTGPTRWPAILAVAAGAVLGGTVGGAALMLAAALALRAWLAMLRLLPRPDPANRNLLMAWAALTLALAALGAERWGLLAAPLGTHLLTMGAAGGMIHAFAARASMARVPGRALHPHGLQTLGLVLVLLAALLRVAGGLDGAALVLSAVLWSAGWAAFLAVHLPALFRPAPSPVFSARLS